MKSEVGSRKSEVSDTKVKSAKDLAERTVDFAIAAIMASQSFPSPLPKTSDFRLPTSDFLP